MNKSKAAFRRYLNEKYSNFPNWKGKGSEGQRKRLYGDYLYFQDKIKFNIEYNEWLKYMEKE